MFWKFIRWGGTLVVILLVLAAVMLGQPQDAKEATENAPVPLQPGEAAPQQNKNFNL